MVLPSPIFCSYAFFAAPPGEQFIPTQQAIDAARSQRNTLRSHPELQRAPEEEFISLDVSTHVASKERESRLVREEDELGDAEDGIIPIISSASDL